MELNEEPVTSVQTRELFEIPDISALGFLAGIAVNLALWVGIGTTVMMVLK